MDEKCAQAARMTKQNKKESVLYPRKLKMQAVNCTVDLLNIDMLRG